MHVEALKLTMINLGPIGLFKHLQEEIHFGDRPTKIITFLSDMQKLHTTEMELR